MTVREQFLHGDPATLPLPLRALWLDGHGNWQAAHEAAQADEDDPGSAWVHAYLHRREGDISNASYWYRRAGRPVFAGALNVEWEALLLELWTERRTVNAGPV